MADHLITPIASGAQHGIVHHQVTPIGQRGDGDQMRAGAESFGKELLALTQRVFYPLALADVPDDAQEHAFTMDIRPNGAYLDREGPAVLAPVHGFKTNALRVSLGHL